MAAPDFRARSTTAFATAADVVLTKPTGTVDGDILYAAVVVAFGVTVTPPAGWTAFGAPHPVSFGPGLNDFTQYLYWKRAASEGSSWTWSHSSAQHWGQVAAYSGALASGDPWDVSVPSSDQPTTTQQNPTAPSITTVTADTLLIFHWAYDTGTAGSRTPPAGWTSRGNDSDYYWYDKAQAATGATGAVTEATSNASTWIANLIALKPATGGGATATPGTLALSITGFAPTVSNPQGMAVPTLSLTLTTFAPVIGLGIIPPTLALTITTFAPTVSTTSFGNVTATPGTLALTITAFAPTVSTPQTVTPGTLALVISTFAPVIGLAVSPGTLALTITSFAPTVLNPQSATPPTLALVLTPFAPTIAVTSSSAYVPPTLALTMTMFAPVVTTPTTVTVPTLALVITRFAPVIGLQVTPGPLSLVLTSFAPVVTATANVTASPGTLALVITLFAPTVVAPQAFTPGTLSLVTTMFAPIVSVVLVYVPPAQLTEEARALAYRTQQENREAFKVTQELALRGSGAAYRAIVLDTAALLPWGGSDASEAAARRYAEQRERDLAGNPAALAALKARTAGLIPWDGWDVERRVLGDESGEDYG